MICPICSVELRMAERQGVEIDYCPKCRGIWLDRGELEKLIERSDSQPVSQEYPPVATYQSPTPKSYYRDDDDDDYEHKRQGNYGAPYQKKRKKNFLGEIFDFD